MLLRLYGYGGKAAACGVVVRRDICEAGLAGFGQSQPATRLGCSIMMPRAISLLLCRSTAAAPGECVCRGCQVLLRGREERVLSMPTPCRWCVVPCMCQVSGVVSLVRLLRALGMRWANAIHGAPQRQCTPGAIQKSLLMFVCRVCCSCSCSCAGDECMRAWFTSLTTRSCGSCQPW